MPNMTVLRMEAEDVLTNDMSSVGLDADDETVVWPVQ